jgi:hypothetical protein
MTPTLVLVGALSFYYPGDHSSGTKLSCGGPFLPSQHHIAIRSWRGRCGAPARVCSKVTKRCVWTEVQDSGPWGAVDTKGRWHCWTKKLPAGWKRRSVVDLTIPVWEALGKPPFLSRVKVEIFRREAYTS